MSKQQKAAALALVVGLAFVALQFGFDIQTGLAGLFVTGIAGGLLLGDAMERGAKKAKP